MWKMLLVKNQVDKTYDINQMLGTITWDTYLSVTSELQFPLLYSDTIAWPTNPADIGDMAVLTKDGQEVGRWILCKSSQQGRNPISFTGYDWAWYLAQSTTVYQFNGVRADVAIKRILTDFGMVIGDIAPMSAMIHQIYIKKKPSDVIDDIIMQQEQQSGLKYAPEMVRGAINILPTKERVITGAFTLAGVTADMLANILDAKRDRDLTQMRNRIRIITTGSNTYQTDAIAQDASTISHYGLIEETFKVNAADAAKSRQVANILLKRLNRILENNTITVMGDTAVRAGYLINIVEPITGITGQYLISQVKNTLQGQVHTMQVTLVLPMDVTLGVGVQS